MKMRALDIERKTEFMKSELMPDMFIWFEYGELMHRALGILREVSVDVIRQGNRIERLGKGRGRDLFDVDARSTLTRDETPFLKLVHGLLDGRSAHMIFLRELHHGGQLVIWPELSALNRLFDFLDDSLVLWHVFFLAPDAARGIISPVARMRTPMTGARILGKT